MLQESHPHLFSILSHSIKAKQKSKTERGSAGINTGQPKFYSNQIMGGPYNDGNK
jgi:hypothetical protein